MALISTRNDVAWTSMMENVYTRIRNVAIIPTQDQVLMEAEYWLNKAAREEAKLAEGDETARQVLPILQFSWGCKLSEISFSDIGDKDKVLEEAYAYVKTHFGFDQLGYTDDI